ncbi:MAG: hypothetical protein ABIP06_09430 [Pyrinomonadaceae bacterium]
MTDKNFMAEEISDDRFKSEVMRLLNTVIVKLGDHDKNFESIDQRFESIDQRFDKLEEKIDQNTEGIVTVKNDMKILKGQFTDVVGMVLEDNKRITKIEKDVEDLQSSIH